MISLKTLLRAAALAASLTVCAPAIAGDTDAGAIRHLMMVQFDRPELRLTVEPVTIHKDIAVAGWAQGEMGGRALLRRQGDQWRLVLCSGDLLKEAGSLRQFGLNAGEAYVLATAVIEAEAKLDSKLVTKFSTFDGVMRMDPHGNHPPISAPHD